MPGTCRCRRAEFMSSRPYPVRKGWPCRTGLIYMWILKECLHVGSGCHTMASSPTLGLKRSSTAALAVEPELKPKTQNAGHIVQDLLRLCIFVKEERSSHRDNGRYFLVVFNREPGAYLAFQRRPQNGLNREWLRQLLSPGRHRLEISLDGEAATFIKTMGAGFAGLTDALELSLDVVTYTFEPAAKLSEFLYWGYLVRIINFTVRLGSDDLVYDDSDDAVWSEQQVAKQQHLAERVLGLMGDGG